MSTDELLLISKRYYLPSSPAAAISSGYIVKPWIENDFSTKISFRLDTQYALFKCMHSMCIFATNDRDLHQEHLENHLKFIRVLDNCGKISNDMLQIQEKYLDCCYCDWHLRSCAKLVNHILDEHKISIFQCQYCFYRTIEGDNILLHYEKFHLFEKKNEFLLCDGDERRGIDDDYVKHLEAGLRDKFDSLNYGGM